MKICESIVYASILFLLMPSSPYALSPADLPTTTRRLSAARELLALTQSFPSRDSFGFEATRYGLKLDLCPNGARPEFTALGNVKWCHADFECTFSYECVNIIGLNHFGTQVRYCCPTRTTICTIKPLLSRRFEVNCIRQLPAVPIYYFDVDKLRCVQARVPECVTEDGTTISVGHSNNNRFMSVAECRTKCETTACELGESILLRQHNFDQPFLCQLNEDCPPGYNCRQDKLFRRGVCCGYMTFEPCPQGFRSFIVPFTGRPKTCFKSQLRDECPTDYVCVQNDVNQLQYCCTLDGGVCPPSQQPYIHPLTDRTIKCNPNSYEAACPHGYACSARIFGSIWGFCCSLTMSNANCPVDSTPLLNHATNLPQKCEEDTCGPGYYCQKNQRSQYEEGFCCLRIKPEQTLVPRSQLLKLTTNSSTQKPPLSGEVEPFIIPPTETPVPPTSTTTSSLEHASNEEDGQLETHEEHVRDSQQQSNEQSQSKETEDEAESSIQPEIDWSELESEIDQILTKKTSELKKKRKKKTKKTRSKKAKHGKQRKKKKKKSKKFGRGNVPFIGSARRLGGAGAVALKCPRNYKPISYPGTQFQLHCSQDEEENTPPCPEPSICLYAVGDRLARSLCCAPIINAKMTSMEKSELDRRTEESLEREEGKKHSREEHTGVIYSSEQEEDYEERRVKAMAPPPPKEIKTSTTVKPYFLSSTVPK